MAWYDEMTENRFKTLWEKKTQDGNYPHRMRNIVEIEFKELEENVIKQDPKFVQELVSNLYAGDYYLVRNVFEESYLRGLLQKNLDYWKNTPTSFHKMLEGCPDFHHLIDEELSKKYYGEPVKHSYYFYPWNGDPLNLFKPIREKWRIFKTLGGMDPLQYENNTPKDGVCDRIQFAQYPAGSGRIATHEDPYKHVNPIISTYLSKRGEDFQTGGVYFVNQQDKKVDLEENVNVGDVGLAFPTVAHGVDRVDAHITNPDWDSPQGRWWLGMFSNMSEEVKNRHTWRKVEIPGLEESTNQ